jgi:hypothetical protein
MADALDTALLVNGLRREVSVLKEKVHDLTMKESLGEVTPWVFYGFQ